MINIAYVAIYRFNFSFSFNFAFSFSFSFSFSYRFSLDQKKIGPIPPTPPSDQSRRDGGGHRPRAGGADQEQPPGGGHHVHCAPHGAAGGPAGRAAEEPHARRQGQRRTQPQQGTPESGRGGRTSVRERGFSKERSRKNILKRAFKKVCSR